MDERRREAREKNIKSMQKSANPLSQSVFGDAAEDLNGLSAQDFENIPEAPNNKIKKRKSERYTPVPDSVILAGLAENKFTRTDMTMQGHSAMQVELERLSDSVQGITNVNKQGYITELDNRSSRSSLIDTADLKKKRLLMKNLLKTNPENIEGWIAYARIEEQAGNLEEARKVIVEATTKVLNSVDIWKECAWLHVFS